MIKSEFFTLSELTKSATAKKLNIDNTPPADVVENLQYGCDMVLDPLRRLYGGPIVIGSGYRCKQLNKKVGGVPNSWHQEGNAADIRVKDIADAKLNLTFLKNCLLLTLFFANILKLLYGCTSSGQDSRPQDIITISTI